MRFKLLILGVVFNIPSVFAQSYFHFSGNISNPQQEYITFTLYPDWVSTPREYNLKLDGQNNFVLELELNQIAYCDVSFGEHGLALMKIEPKDQIHVTFNNDDFYNTLLAYGPGSEKWSFQLMLKKQFEVQRDLGMELSNQTKASKDTFFKITQKAMLEQIELLRQSENTFSNAFFELQIADIVGEFKIRELGYLTLNKLPISELDFNWNQFSEETKSRSYYLGELASALIESQITNRYKNTPTLEYEYIRGFENSFGKGLAERLLATKVIDFLNINGLNEEINYLKDSYFAYAENALFKNAIAKEIKKRQSLTVGIEAPNFIVTDKKGKFKELRDYRGKNLVLGFYNNECQSCLEDMEAMRVVENFYSQRGKKDLYFLFINLSNEAFFKNFLKTRSLIGEHLNGYENPLLAKNYNVDVIPNYLLIDRYGKILANDLEEPRLDEGRALIELLGRLIYRK